jgi:serine/threonine protein kinase/Tfp pilus assembly protein PilF
VSQQPADRNLLFGILALQMDFITRDDLVGAMQAWVLEKQTPLGRILVARGSLAEDEFALLEPLVAKHLRRHGDDPERSLAAAAPAAAAAVREALRGVADAEVEATLSHLGRDPTATPAPSGLTTRMASVGAPTADGERFQILRFHAKGGLGQVFVARDDELNREVALKEIQDRHADDEESRTRFLLEAEVTGALEHPGIVPVYSLGRHLDGRPFYAMRFIRGDSFKDAIDRFHGPSGPDPPPPRDLEFRKLLGRFVALCNTVAYAHSRGVLHRDIKPANVMLGPFGETLVVDWGLAKPMDRPELDPTSEERPIRPSSGGSVYQTMAGTPVGTPGFMSPEQAAGELDRLGPTSDIFSLGATLYALLTGRGPFSGRDLGEVRRKILSGDWPAPRQVRREVPRPLEAICLKAMARSPSGRYASARDLADDIEHWLADEPVAAHRERWGERLARWSRRHRAWTRAAAASLLAISAVSVVAAVVVNGARHREAEAYRQKEEKEERLRIRREADQARALEEILRGRAAIAANDVDRAREVASALGTLLAADTMSPELVAQGRALIAAIRSRQAERAEVDRVEAAYRDFRTLADDATYHRMLSEGINPRAELDRARAAARAALALFGVREDQDAAPAIPVKILGRGRGAEVRDGLYELLVILADAEADVPREPDQTDEDHAAAAMAGSRRALRILDRARRLGIRTRSHHLRCAGCLEQCGDTAAAERERALARAFEPTRASDFFLAGIELLRRGELAGAADQLERALRADPGHFWAQFYLASCKLRMHLPAEAKAHLTAALGRRPGFLWGHLLRGVAHDELKDYDAAEADFRAAEAIDAKEAGIFVNRGAMEIHRGRLDAAVADLRRAIQLRPDQYQARMNLATALARQKRFGQAAVELDEAVRRVPSLPALYIQRGHLNLERGNQAAGLRDLRLAVRLTPAGTPLAHRFRAEEYLEQGKPAEAIREFDRFLAFGEPVADVFRARGLAKARLGDYPGALDDYNRSLELDPDAPNILVARGWAYYNAPDKLALHEFERAVAINERNGVFIGDAYSGRGFFRALRGDYRPAVEDAEKALRHGRPDAWSTPFNVACIYAQAMERAVGDAPDLANTYREQALRLIRAAVDVAPVVERPVVWRNVLADPALEPIRRRPEFAALRSRFAALE